jgi:hypothetical protein
MLPSPSPEAVTPQRGVPEASGPVSVPQDRPADSKNLGEIKKEAYNPSTAPSYSTATGGSIQSTFNSAAASVSNAMPSSGDLQAQLDEAKAQIARLTQQAGEATGLRQRKTEPAHDSKQQSSAALDTRQAPAGGVSVQITALLCLVSFLLAYFLF